MTMHAKTGAAPKIITVSICGLPYWRNHPSDLAYLRTLADARKATEGNDPYHFPPNIWKVPPAAR